VANAFGTHTEETDREASLKKKEPKGFHVPDGNEILRTDFPAVAELIARTTRWVVCTENLIRVDDVMESPKLAE